MKKKNDTRWFPAQARISAPHRFIGIDPSLSSTGICIIEDGKIVTSYALSPPKGLMGIERLAWFYAHFMELLAQRVVGIAIEGYSYGSPNNREALAELGGVLRLAIYFRKTPTLVVAPPTLRKFILTDAQKGKDYTILASYKKWGVEFKTNDECDAHALARLAEVRFHLDTIATVDSSITQRMIEAADTANPLVQGDVILPPPPKMPVRPRMR